jgi:hypothetical protein
MNYLKAATGVALAVSMAGCATMSDLSTYCENNRPACVIGGILIAGGVVLGGMALLEIGPFAPAVVVSDARLKRDITPYRTLDNGVQIYSFRYLGDDRYFTGVLAQDLLKNPATAKAVDVGENGYYAVDYSKLGLKLFGAEAMEAAGQHAAEMAGHA